MPYIIAFWRPGAHGYRTEQTYRLLRRRVRVAGLLPIRSADILAQTAMEFQLWRFGKDGCAAAGNQVMVVSPGDDLPKETGWRRVGLYQWESVIDGAAFALHFVPCGGWFDCENVSNETIQTLLRLVRRCGCGVYDPQKGQWSPPPQGWKLPADWVPNDPKYPETSTILEKDAFHFFRLYAQGEGRAEIRELLDNGDFRAAYGRLSDALAREGEQGDLYLLRAFCSRKLHRTPQCNRDLDTAIALCPEDVLLRRARCKVIATKSRYALQICDLSRLIVLDPAHAGEYRLHRAYCFHWTGNQDAAREDLLKIYQRRDAIAWLTQDFWYLFRDLCGKMPKIKPRRALNRMTRTCPDKGHQRARFGWPRRCKSAAAEGCAMRRFAPRLRWKGMEYRLLTGFLKRRRVGTHRVRPDFGDRK